METEISDVHYEILKQFKRNVADILNTNDTDLYLLKWLKSKNYHIYRAETSLREERAFRNFFSLESICKTHKQSDVAEKYGYTIFLGYAKDGTVIRYSALGKGDHYGLISSLSAYQLGTYAIHFMDEDCENQRKRKRITGENVTEITYVCDLDGLNIQELLHRCVYETGTDLLHLAQEFYPEAWGNVFFINAPPYFDVIFNLFKPVFRMSVIQNMQVLSKDSTPQVLLKYIDEDVLPMFLGGKRTDMKPLGVKVPEMYYLSNLPPLNPNDPGVTDVWLRPRSCYNHSVMISKPNTTIRVEVRTERGSIQMSAYYRSFDQSNSNDIDTSPLEECVGEEHKDYHFLKVSPLMKVQTHLSPINDKNFASKPGIYIYRFVNVSSWFTSRRLIFRIKAVEVDS